MLKNMTGKQVAIVLGFIVLVAIVLRISEATQATGAWVCRDGQWQKEGRIKEKQPNYICASLALSNSSGEEESEYQTLITLASPRPDQLQTRQIVIAGQAIIGWFNNYRSPASLIDETGQEIIRTELSAQEEGESGLVAFSGRISVPEDILVPNDLTLRLDPAIDGSYPSLYVPLQIR